MTPVLSTLLSAADQAKQSLLLAVAANEHAAKLAAEAAARHEDCYVVAQKAAADLAAARAAIDDALDADYGYAAKATPQADAPCVQTVPAPLPEAAAVSDAQPDPPQAAHAATEVTPEDPPPLPAEPTPAAVDAALAPAS